MCVCACVCMNTCIVCVMFIMHVLVCISMKLTSSISSNKHHYKTQFQALANVKEVENHINNVAEVCRKEGTYPISYYELVLGSGLDPRSKDGSFMLSN